MASTSIETTSSFSSQTTATERRGIPGAQFVEDVQTYLSQLGLDVNSALAFLQERLQQYKLVETKLLAQQRDLQAKIPDIEKCLDVVATLQAKKGTGEDIQILSLMFTGIGHPLMPMSIVSCCTLLLVRSMPCQLFSVGLLKKCLIPELMPSTILPNFCSNDAYGFSDNIKFFPIQSIEAEDLVADFEVSEGIYSRASIQDTDSVCLWLGANVMLEYSYEEATSLLQKNLDNAKASLEVLIADLQFLEGSSYYNSGMVTIARVYNWDVHQRRVRQATTVAKDS
ncbi:hypothetical protein Patl1_24848 [Pistacia atlantica]|uniref:Uncharacterized protein n=1 Tax=Pistacia atlantica TaxID=434234 RepID=A0ACC1B219_9ROSI|nr:hypothetical protein Patl1_24848 [Pistacia atlantica]